MVAGGERARNAGAARRVAEQTRALAVQRALIGGRRGY